MVAAPAAFAAAKEGYGFPEILRKRFEKSTFPRMRPKGGIKMSPTSDVMIFPNDAPMMMPTAMSSTLPRIANSLNSLNIFFASVDLNWNFGHAFRSREETTRLPQSPEPRAPRRRSRTAHSLAEAKGAEWL